MPAAALLTPVSSPLADYLRRNGGKDILTFDSPQEALDAAGTIRRRDHDDIVVSASHHTVHLTLKA